MAQRHTSDAVEPNRPYTRAEKLALKLRFRYQGFSRKARSRCIVCSRLTKKRSRGYCPKCWEKLQPSEREKEAIAERAKQGRTCGTCEATFGACMHTRAALQMELRGCDPMVPVEKCPCSDCAKDRRKMRKGGSRP